MKNDLRITLRSATPVGLFFLFLLTGLTAANAAGAVHFRLRLDPAVAGDTPLSGRLLIFMKKDDGKSADAIEADFSDPNAVYISGTDAWMSFAAWLTTWAA